jgi:hypothetical protein
MRAVRASLLISTFAGLAAASACTRLTAVDWTLIEETAQGGDDGSATAGTSGSGGNPGSATAGSAGTTTAGGEGGQRPGDAGAANGGGEAGGDAVGNGGAGGSP